MISVASEISITSKPEITDFQLRRRRAAKLTNFFGVDYRELVNNVLESIESGLEHERKHGTLQADEIEVSGIFMLQLYHLLIGHTGLTAKTSRIKT